jgi:hypothetical protein
MEMKLLLSDTELSYHSEKHSANRKNAFWNRFFIAFSTSSPPPAVFLSCEPKKQGWK